MIHSKRETVESSDRSEIKQKLTSLADSFQGLEQTIAQKKKKRRDDEEKRITDVKGDLVKIDQEIKCEVKRRAETVNALETLLTDKIVTVKHDIETPFQNKFEQVLIKIAELNKTMDKLGEAITEANRNFPKLVEERTSEMTQQISEFKERFHSDRNTQSEKMEIIEKIIQEQEHRLNHSLQAERVARTQKNDELIKNIDQEAKIRKKTCTTLHEHLKDKCSVITKSIGDCEIKREKTMEDLTQAFVHYTSALQDGVKILAETN